jgi:hypothetical protein
MKTENISDESKMNANKTSQLFNFSLNDCQRSPQNIIHNRE